jgi:hypothetical protein
MRGDRVIFETKLTGRHRGKRNLEKSDNFNKKGNFWNEIKFGKKNKVLRQNTCKNIR